ncbi:MAG: DUF1294 domain-containing protein [Pseudomonadota bacterium]
MTDALAIIALLIVANAAGALLFIKDKRDAVAERRRVPERVLLTLAALGAAPLMVWLSGKIRHKTRKEPFRSVLRAIVALQLLASIGLLAVWFGLL